MLSKSKTTRSLPDEYCKNGTSDCLNHNLCRNAFCDHRRIACLFPACSAQVFVDWVQNNAGRLIHRDASNIQHFSPPTRIVFAEDATDDYGDGSLPAAPSAMTRPSVSISAEPVATTEPTTQTTVIEIMPQPKFASVKTRSRPQPYMLLVRGAALGGATGLSLGLIAGILVSVIDQLVYYFLTVCEVFRMKFFAPNSAFRR